MSENIRRAIEELQGQLEVKLKEVASLKQSVNMLSKQIGQAAPYEEEEMKVGIKSGAGLRSDAFFGKGPMTAAREFLEYKQIPCTPQEILAGLTEGGFDFNTFGWKEEPFRLKNLAISLSKNTP